MENSHSIRISKSYENFSYISNSEHIFKNEKSGNTIRIEFQNKNNINSLSKIDNKFSLSCSNINNNLKESMIENEKDISTISLHDESQTSLDVNSLKNDIFFKTCFKPPKKEDIFERFNYIMESFYNIKKNKFKNTKIRCFTNKKDKAQSNQEISKCDCIPIIKKYKYCLDFNCEQKGRLNICVECLLKHIFNGNLFIPNNNIIKKNKMSEMNDEIKKFRYKINKIICYLYRVLESKFKNYKKYYSIYENESNESIKHNVLKIVFSTFLSACSNFNDYIYYYIIKRLLFENLDLSEENNSELKKSIKENLLESEKNIKKRKRKRRRDRNKICRLLWYTEFYFKEQVKNDKDKCIYIGITLEGYIIIYMLNFLIEKNNEKELYKVIKKEKVKIFQPQKIKKLKNIFLNNDSKEHNYFLLCSPLYKKAIIIDITNNFNNIKLVQEISDKIILINCVEFQYSNSNYLLNVDKNFTLWYYSERIKGLEYKIIDPKIIGEKRFRPIIYLEKRKLFIVENIKSSDKSLEFYTIDDKNIEFSLILIKNIIFQEGKNFRHNNLSDSYNNCCIIKDKYLLIGAKSNFYRDGGIYIINLDNFKLIKYRKFYRSEEINCIIDIGHNMAVCSSKQEIKKGIHNNFISDGINNSNNIQIIDENKIHMPKYQLILFELKETDNEKIILDIKKTLNGNYFWIDCDKLISDSYIICSVKRNNSLIKVDNEDLTYFLIIKSPFE